MKFNRWTLLALVLAASAALWLWSPWKSGQQSVEFDNVNDLVTAAKKKTGDIKNYRYKTDIAVGNQIEVSINNKVERDDPNRQMMDFSWSAPNMNGTASLYAEGDTVILYNPLKREWELPAEEPAVKPFLEFFWRQVNLVDPVENLLAVDINAKNMSIIKNEKEQVKDTVTVQVVPSESAMSEISKALPPQLIGAELTDLKQLFWISKKDQLVSRYEVRAKVSFFGVKSMDFKTVSILSDYNNIEIKMPQQLVDKLNQTKTP